jgi:Flp pilus assembly protein TadD
MGHLELSVGRIADAETSLQQALARFPGYHYALGNLAKVRIVQKRYDEAVELLRQRYQAAPHAENLYDLAEALQSAGRTEEAKRAFAEFEPKSLLESDRGDNSNRELIFYYTDYAHQPLKGLEVARKEFARRHDVYTLDAYAWALHVNGEDQEAHRQIEAALRVGIRDAKLIRHAGEIALALGDRSAAQKYLRQAADLNAIDSDLARTTLTQLRDSSPERLPHTR